MVQVKTDGIQGLLSEMQNKTLICFGAGCHFDMVMNRYASYAIAECVEGILDNDPVLHGTDKIFRGKKYRVFLPEIFVQMVNIDQMVLLITNHFSCMEIVKQLDKIPQLNGLSVYVGSFLSEIPEFPLNFEIAVGGRPKIPKSIHFCWFGKNEIPAEYQHYIKIWRKFCPDYEIRQWNESNFDVSQNKYMYQAYQHRKWAFVSDYARLKVIYEYGGIYLDCDVELLKGMDDFLPENMFCGFEDSNYINFGLGYGAVAHHRYLKRLLEYYDTLNFVNSDGSLNLVPCSVYQTDVLREFGIRADNTFQKNENITVYPTEVFSPVSGMGQGMITEKSYSIHHYGASWQQEGDMDRTRKIYRIYCERKNVHI